MNIDFEALEREAAAAEAAAAGAKLTDEESARAAIVARITRAREEKAAADKTRRETELTAKEMAARSALGPKVLVKGIDLVSLFPLGVSPPAEQLPGDGVIVVRNPLPGRLASFHTEVEHKQRPVASIYADLLVEHVIEPPVAKDMAAGALLRAFVDTYEGAAVAAGDVVAKLGGSKSAADKRGRS